MTEAEWLTCADPQAMLAELRRSYKASSFGPGKRVHASVSDRKLRLFACAMWRRHPDLVTERRAWPALALSERFADGLALREEVDSAREEIFGLPPNENVPYREWVRRASRWLCGLGASVQTRRAEAAAQADLLREVFGNPFRPVNLASVRWGQANGAVLALAGAAYDERLPGGHFDPDRLAVLADALEEAGCPAVVSCQLCKGQRVFRGVQKKGGPETGPKIHYIIEPNMGDIVCPRCGGSGLEPGCTGLLAHLRGPAPHVRGCWAVDLILGKE